MTSINEAIQAVRKAQGIKEPEKIEEKKTDPIYIFEGCIEEPATKPGGLIYCNPEHVRIL